jgi:hypothetical protein
MCHVHLPEQLVQEAVERAAVAHKASLDVGKEGQQLGEAAVERAADAHDASLDADKEGQQEIPGGLRQATDKKGRRDVRAVEDQVCALPCMLAGFPLLLAMT